MDGYGMSQFEFISVGTSIVLALSVARLLEGLRDSFDPSRSYWIHSVWVVNKLLNTALFFWAGWLYGQREDWNFAEFLALIVGPGILYLQVHTLLTTHPDKVEDWSAHFWRIRRWFFGANIFLILSVAFNTHYLSARPFPSPETVPAAVILLFSILGFASANKRLHGFIAIVGLLNLILGYGSLFVLSAGGFGP